MKRFFSKPILLLGLLLMAVQVTLYAQNEVTVTGVVTSAEDGSPIPYASVVAT